MATTNGGQPQEQTPAGAAPQLNVLAQYAKDLSVREPECAQGAATAARAATRDQCPDQCHAQAAHQHRFRGRVEARGQGGTRRPSLFGFELVYAGVFRLQNIPQEKLGAVVMIECPRLLFPFAREIVAGAVTSGGYPPLMLDPVDFVALYRQKMAQRLRYSGSRSAEDRVDFQPE